MNGSHNENKDKASQNLQLWYCEHCRHIHFKTQNVMIDFSKSEFVDLTNAVLDICQNHLDPLEISRLADLVADDVLTSETIS